MFGMGKLGLEGYVLMAVGKSRGFAFHDFMVLIGEALVWE